MASPVHDRRLFEHLAEKFDPFESKVVVPLDDLVVHSLFGQQTPKKRYRTHIIQNIDPDFKDNKELSNVIYTEFEAIKAQLDSSNPMGYISDIKSLSLRLYRSSSYIKRISPKASGVLEWMLLAYSMVIQPSSAVKLSVTKMGLDDKLGFSIIATRFIKVDEPIYELIGAMPGDTEARHSELSAIIPHPAHNVSDQASRVFFGPARFINHLCQSPNTALCCVAGTAAFFAYAIRNIQPKEEITWDYGSAYFDDCPCIVCKPVQEEGSKRQACRSGEEIEAEKREKRSAKRRRRNKKQKSALLQGHPA